MKIGEIFWKTFRHCGGGGGGDGGPVVLLALLLLLLLLFLLLQVGPKVENLKWTGRWVFSLIIIEEDLDPKSWGGGGGYFYLQARQSLFCLFVCFFFSHFLNYLVCSNLELLFLPVLGGSLFNFIFSKIFYFLFKKNCVCVCVF
jgi:hypothetical protein